jgi:hypothetical protein
VRNLNTVDRLKIRSGSSAAYTGAAPRQTKSNKNAQTRFCIGKFPVAFCGALSALAVRRLNGGEGRDREDAGRRVVFFSQIDLDRRSV